MSTAHIIDAYENDRSLGRSLERCQERLRGLDAVIYRVGTNLAEWARSHRVPLDERELLRMNSGVSRAF